MKTYTLLFFSLFGMLAIGQTGIGTTSPVNKFQVETTPADPATSGSAANGNLRLSSSSGNHVLDFGLSSSSSFAWLQSRLKTNYGTNYPLLLNPNGGNVGIGTTNPTAKLNLVGGGIRLHDGFSNATARPVLTTSVIGNFEIRGVGSASGTSQTDGGDDGFLRLSAGGGTNLSAQASIDISGFSSVNDMNSNIVMRTGGTERFRINNSGKIGIGSAAPSAALHIENGNSMVPGENPESNSVPSVYVYNSNTNNAAANSIVGIRTAGAASGKPYLSLDINGVSGYSMGINNPSNQLIINTTWNFDTNSSSNNALTINRSGQTRVAIPSAGGNITTDWPSGWGGGLATYDIVSASILAGNFVTRSDRRLKNTVANLETGIVAQFLKLRPVTYYWNQDQPRDTRLQYGLIAQEVETVFPEMVTTATDSIQTKAVNYQALHAMAIKVIQEQQKQIDSLQQQQATLAKRLELLEAKK